MRIVLSCFIAAVCCVSNLSQAAVVVNQIPAGSPFPTTGFGPANPTVPTSALSMFDSGVLSGNSLPNFATVFDNFTLGSSTDVNGFGWVGAYELANVDGNAPDFTVSIFSDVAGAPSAAPVASFNLGAAVNETAITTTGGLPGFFSYSASVAPTTLAAGDYWISIVDTLPFASDGWGLAFSSIGNGASIQDFQDDENVAALVRHNDAIDYAFSVSAVPEPSSGLLMAGIFGIAAFRRRRKLA